MLYEVKKDGQVVYTTKADAPPYDRKTEKSMQNAGYEIFVDGKKRRQS